MSQDLENKIPQLDQLANNNHQDWLEAIQKSIKSGTIDELYTAYQNIQIDPFVDPQINRKAPLLSQKRDWFIGVDIPDGSPHDTNASILYFLQNGAEAIRCSPRAQEMALTDVHTEMIYLDGIPNMQSKNHHKINLSSQAKELDKELIELAQQIINQLVNKTNPNTLSITIKIEPHLAIAVSKIRAFRIIWLNLLKAHQIECAPAFIIADIFSTKENQDTAMIDLSAKAMYAVLGGVDLMYLDGQGFDLNQKRIAMNIQHIMKMESKLHLVDDPMAGAYAIESLTQSIATKVWAQLSA